MARRGVGITLLGGHTVPIDTYSELQTAIEEWLEGDDISARTQDLIALAEATFNREIRTREMRTVASEVALDATGKNTLPADFIEALACTVNTNPKTVPEYFPPSHFFTLSSATAAGTPAAYTILGDEIRWAPKGDVGTTYTLEYLQPIPALSATNTTNWLLTKAPDVYLYGALLQAEPYLRNDERLPVWATLLQRGIDSLHQADARARYRPRGRMHPNASGSSDGRWRLL